MEASATTVTSGAPRQYFVPPPRSYLLDNPVHVHAGAGAGQAMSDVGVGREGSAAAPTSSAAPTKKRLSSLLLTGIMYSFTIGGGYGIEESVMGGGPLFTLLSIIVIPVVMGMPTALVVAEMASAVPSNAGFLMWINLVFHRTIYFAMVLLSLLLIFVDNALYPVLFSEYMCTAMTCSRLGSALLRLAMIGLTFVLNVMGAEVVGGASVALTVGTVAPFVLMFLVQQWSTGFYLNWPAISFIPAKMDWATFLTTASWNLSGLEQAGNLAEDVRDPQRTIIQSLVPLLGLAYITYMPPILTGASVLRGPLDLSEWVTGFWTEVSYRVGGSVLKNITITGSVLSAFGLTLSALCTTTRMIAGMAFTEAFPGRLGWWLSQRNVRYGTCHWALILNTTLTAAFSTLMDFGPLVKVDQFLYGIRVIFIFLAFLRFRRMYRYIERPFRVPLDGWRLYAVFVPSLSAFVVLTLIAMLQDTETVIWCACILAVVGVVSFLFCHFVRKERFLGRIVTLPAGSDN